MDLFVCTALRAFYTQMLLLHLVILELTERV